MTMLRAAAVLPIAASGRNCTPYQSKFCHSDNLLCWLDRLLSATTGHF
jgi:hypothetical protein